MHDFTITQQQVNNNNNNNRLPSKISGWLANPGGKRLKPIEEIYQEELKACLSVYTHLRGLQLQKFIHEIRTYIRAVAIMFVSVARHHLAKHLHKCAQFLRFSISRKFKNLHRMLISVRLYLVHLDSACLKCFKTSARNSVHPKKKAVLDPFLRSAPHSKTFAQICSTITLLD